MKYIQIDIKEIIVNKKYSYHVDLDVPVLIQSVKSVGIVQPLWCIPGKKFLIIDGHRRYIAAKQACLKQLPIFSFEPVELEEIFLKALHTHLTTQGLSIVEKLKALKIALDSFTENALEEVKNLLGFNHIPGVEFLAKTIHQLPDWMITYFHGIEVSLRMLSRLLKYSFDEYQPWFHLATNLHFKGPELMTLLEQVRDIGLRDQISAKDLFIKLEMDQLLKSPFTPQQKSQKVKNIVKSFRMPVYHHIEKRLQNISQNVKKQIPGPIQISWDKSLENPGIMLTLFISHPKDYPTFVDSLNQPEIHKKIEEMLQTISRLPQEA